MGNEDLKDLDASEIYPQRIKSKEVLITPEGESEEPQPTEPKDPIEHRVQLNMSKEMTFPTPLKYIDVPRSTHKNLDVMQDKLFYDCWNVADNNNLSGSLAGFTTFTFEREASTKIYVVQVKTD